MKVIRFPGAAPDEVAATKSKKSAIHRLVMDTAMVTCTECGTSCDISMHNMVFRTLDFYCGCCGRYYKVTNPAFSPPAPRRAK